MPSGKTHDSISWYLFLPLAYLSWYLKKDWMIVMLFSTAYLFSCFMFSGDLDLVSVQSKRWGIFRWIWLPYRKLISHRSKLSHDPFIGTAFRLFYVSIWGCLFYGLFYIISLNYFPNENKEMLKITQTSLTILKNQPKIYFIAIFAGLCSGAALHTGADIIFSFFKKKFRFLRKKKRKNKR